MRTQLVSKLCLCYILFLLILSIGVCGIEKVKVFSFFSNLHSNFLEVIAAPFSRPLSRSCRIWESWIYFLILPPSSHPARPSRFVSGRLLQRAQGDTWLLRHRWVAVSPPGLLTTASWPPSLFSPFVPEHWVQTPAPPRAFCCSSATQIYGSAVRSGSLTHFQLTDTIIHCLYWGGAV